MGSLKDINEQQRKELEGYFKFTRELKEQNRQMQLYLDDTI